MPLNPAITDWRGKRVWLVGASSGIGRAVAAQLHAQGAQVIVSARQQALLAAFAHEHPGSQAVVLDVTDAQAVLDVAARLQTESPLDLVCYCAGHYTPMRADALALPELLRHQQVNLTGALHVLAAVVPGLLASAQAGRVPHLSLVASVAGWRGLPQSLAYGPTKAALINLAETLFLDLRPQGVGGSESPRVLRRLQHLRRWSYEQVTEVLPGSARARRAHGAGAPSRLPVAVGSD